MTKRALEHSANYAAASADGDSGPTRTLRIIHQRYVDVATGSGREGRCRHLP